MNSVVICYLLLLRKKTLNFNKKRFLEKDQHFIWEESLQIMLKKTQSILKHFRAFAHHQHLKEASKSIN